MTSKERSTVRWGLINTGFKRTRYTDDFGGTGVYDETWEHRDGTEVTVRWTEREHG